MTRLGILPASRKTGAEPFTADGQPVGPELADFWGWSMSDLVNNTARAVVAELIVASALSIPTDGVRESWAAWDLTTPEGIRVEVKSAACTELAPISSLRDFLHVTETLAWEDDAGMSEEVARRQAQVYVFALLFHTETPTTNPLNLDQWRFYVLPPASRTRASEANTRSRSRR